MTKEIAITENFLCHQISVNAVLKTKRSQNNRTSLTCNRPLKIKAEVNEETLLLGDFINNNSPYILCFFFLISHFTINFDCMFSNRFKCPDGIRDLLKMTHIMVKSE